MLERNEWFCNASLRLVTLWIVSQRLVELNGFCAASLAFCKLWVVTQPVCELEAELRMMPIYTLFYVANNSIKVNKDDVNANEMMYISISLYGICPSHSDSFWQWSNTIAGLDGDKLAWMWNFAHHFMSWFRCVVNFTFNRMF